MKKRIRIILTASIVIVILLLAVSVFIYFDVERRVVINPNAGELFQNSVTIERLDSTQITADSLTEYINNLIKRAHVHGLGITIINGNQIVYQTYFGKRNVEADEAFSPGSVWQVASLSKTIFSDVVLQLAEENIIALDSPVYKYLPQPLYSYKTNTIERLTSNYFDYSDLRDDARYKEITARMCLSHTSGFPNWRWMEGDGKLKIKFKPGSQYSYSGEGMFLLQFVIEHLTGKSFEQIAVDKVFTPLKMGSSSYVWQSGYEGNHVVGHDDNDNLGIKETRHANAAGSLLTSLEDYTKFFADVLKQEKIRYRQLLMPQIRIRSKQQFGPNAAVVTNENDSIRLSYGLGFGLYETSFGRVFFKEGHDHGWQHYAVGFPDRKLGLIIFANSNQGESIFKEIIEVATGNTYTPWFWEGYIPYDLQTR